MMPPAWPLRTLKRVAPIQGERIDARPPDAPYVALENIEPWTGRLLPGEAVEASEGGIVRFQEGDVLFGKLRPYLAKVARPDFAGVASAELVVLRPQQVLPEFLQYYLLTPAVVSQVNSWTFGTKMPRVSADVLGRVEVRVPPMEEQHAIVRFLHEKTKQINALLDRKERLEALLHEEWESEMQPLLFGGNAAVLEDVGVEWLWRLPPHWRVVRAGLLFRERDERGEPALPQLEVSLKKGVALRNFAGDRIERVASDLGNQKVARRGDLVFNKMRMWQGAVGVAPEDGLVSTDYTVAVPNGDILSTYAQMVLKTQRGRTEIDKWSHGMVRDRNRLYWAGFRNIRLPVPPLEEQRQILNRIEAGSRRCEALCSKINDASARLREYRAALITAAVTGRIGVRDVA